MDYGALLSRAFQVVARAPAIWVFGLGVALAEGMGIQNPGSFTAEPNCFVTDWLLLGPYSQPSPTLNDPSANPRVATMQRDHLCDGAAANELDIEPRDGDVVNTTYAPDGCARSIGLAAELGGAPINPGDQPTWYAWRDLDDTIGFNDYYGGDIDRIVEIWKDCLARYGGPFLFGRKPGMADAMYAPVATRFLTYDVKLDAVCAAYCKRILELPAMKEWIEQARREPEEIDELEAEF